MKYSESVDVNKPRDQVAALLRDPACLPKWQKGFVSIEALAGPPGEAGATARLDYAFGKRSITMTETLIATQWPESWIATYEASGVWNRQENRLIAVSPQITRWESDCEFRFATLPMKLMGWLMPGAFRKQTRAYLADFKAFAESGQAAQP